MSSILLKWGIFNALRLTKMDNIQYSNMFDRCNSGGRDPIGAAISRQ